jgi:hypothetical protein
MKKILLCILSVVILSCNSENDADKKNTLLKINKLEMQEEDSSLGIPPHFHIFYQITGKVDQYATNEITEMYRNDIQEADANYVENLKNMWFSFICEKIATEGSEAEKLYFSNEQIELTDNIANVSSFYSLLVGCQNQYSKEAFQEIANQFNQKNTIAIEKANWKNMESKDKRLAELVYQKRTINLINH